MLGTGYKKKSPFKGIYQRKQNLEKND